MDHIKYGPVDYRVKTLNLDTLGPNAMETSKHFKPFWTREKLGDDVLDGDGDWNVGSLPKVPVSKPAMDEKEVDMKFDKGLIIASVLSDFSLALMAVAEVSTFGSVKYKRSSWQFVKNAIMRYSDAKWRHLLKQGYELHDEQSGLLHEAHELWNSLAVLELKLRNARAVV
jgi:hypothetical protein